MAKTLDIVDFKRSLEGKTIDLAAARADARLTGLDLAKVDLNDDGKISKGSEFSALFRVIDRFDRNGRSRSVSLTSPKVLGMIQASGDLAGVNIIANTKRDNILLVGMNVSSTHEAKELRLLGNKVEYIGDSRTDDVVVKRGRTFSLRDDTQLKEFVDLMGLPPRQADEVLKVIKSAGADAKDELANVAWVWAAAENGDPIPKRLIISGHSVGVEFWGENNGGLDIAIFGKLAKVLPKAARQIEDLHLSACYSSSEEYIKQWRKIFPGVKTIWAYTDSAPGSYSGATKHMALWDNATRGDKAAIDRLLARGTRKGKNVAVWSQIHGYQAAPQTAFRDLDARVTGAEPLYKDYFSGMKNVVDTQTGPLREYYNDVQAMLQHPDLPSGRMPALEARRDATIRLIYYDKSIKKNFANNKRQLIERGYRALGKPVPDFASLSRKDALTAIQVFERAIAGGAGPLDARNLLPHLTEGLRDLKATHIPSSWI